MTRLTFSNGAVVNVAAEKLDNLLRHGFAEVEKASAKAASTARKAPAKKAAAKKSE